MRGVNLSHLGAPIGPMIRVHGGFANRMYRLDTDQGSFAVKELNLDDRRWTYRIEDVFRFERAVFAMRHSDAGADLGQPPHARPPVGRGNEDARSTSDGGVRVRDR